MISFADKSFLVIVSILIIAAIIILTYVAILDLLTKRKSRINLRNNNGKLRKIIKNLVNKIVPNENSLNYRKKYLKIKESGMHLNIKQFYILKVVIPIVTIILAIPVLHYNYINSNDYIIKKVNISKGQLLLNKNVEKVTESYKKEKELENEKYFQVIKQNISLEDIKKYDKTKEISKLLEKEFSLNKQDSIIEAMNMQNKIRELKDKKDFFLFILLVCIISYRLMDIALHFIHKYKSINRESEKILINRLVLGLGKITNIKVYEIITKLAEITNIYKYLFQECLEEYENGNHIEALREIKGKTDDQDIIEIIDLFIMANQKATINDIIDEFELNQAQKNGNIQMLDNIRVEKIIGKSQFLVGTSLFVVVLCLSIPLLGIFDIFNF